MGCHCSPRCYSRCNDYKTGYEAGYQQARAEDDILNGEDPTMYLFVGGPYHNDYKKTGGKPYVTAMIAPQLSAAMYCSHSCTTLCGHRCCDVRDITIRSGTYEKTRTTKGWSVYRWNP